MVLYAISFPPYLPTVPYLPLIYSDSFIRGLVRSRGRKQTRLGRCVYKSKTQSLNERAFGITRVCVLRVNSVSPTKKKKIIRTCTIHGIGIHNSEAVAVPGTRTSTDVIRGTPATSVFLTVHILKVLPPFFFFFVWHYTKESKNRLYITASP